MTGEHKALRKSSFYGWERGREGREKGEKRREQEEREKVPTERTQGEAPGKMVEKGLVVFSHS
jgi:hypothetical protein